MRSWRGYVSSESSVSSSNSSINDSASYASTNVSDGGNNKKSISRKKKSKNNKTKTEKKSKKLRRTINEPYGILIPKHSGRRKASRVRKIGHLNVTDKEDNILIINSACNQSMIHVAACKVRKHFFFNRFKCYCLSTVSK